MASIKFALADACCIVSIVTVESDFGELLLLEFLRTPNAFLGGACHAEEAPARLPIADAMSAAKRTSWRMTLEVFMVVFFLW